MGHSDCSLETWVMHCSRIDVTSSFSYLTPLYLKATQSHRIKGAQLNLKTIFPQTKADGQIEVGSQIQAGSERQGDMNSSGYHICMQTEVMNTSINLK